VLHNTGILLQYLAVQGTGQLPAGIFSSGECVRQIIEHGTLSMQKNASSFVGYSHPDPDAVFFFKGRKG
jgi:hypothetical protein